MKAIQIEMNPAGPALVIRDLPAPRPGPRQIGVRVHTASVNRADLAQRAGTHHAVAPGSPPPVVGLDAAGEVVSIGSEVDGIQVGDRVMTMVSGGLSEEIVVDATMAVPIPRAWSYAEGAAAILGLMTEHNALRTHGRLGRGESVLIHAAASSVGLQAVQLARHLGAGLVIATTRRDRADGLLRSLGADHVIHPGAAGFADEVLALTGGLGADVIIDHVGGPYLADNIRCIAVQGRLIGIGRLGGAEGTLDMEALALKRASLIGVTFRTRDGQEKADLVAAMRSEIDLDAEDLRPVIDRLMPWTEVEQAQALMAANSHLGKIVLTVGDTAAAGVFAPA